MLFNIMHNYKTSDAIMLNYYNIIAFFINIIRNFSHIIKYNLKSNNTTNKKLFINS